MFIGGVSTAKESPFDTLLREIQEEVGIDLSVAEPNKDDSVNADSNNNMQSKSRKVRKRIENKAYYLKIKGLDLEEKPKESTFIMNIGKTVIKTSYNYCVVHCFAINLSNAKAEKIEYRDGEIEWGKWVSIKELYNLVEESEDKFVPGFAHSFLVFVGVCW